MLIVIKILIIFISLDVRGKYPDPLPPINKKQLKVPIVFLMSKYCYIGKIKYFE